MYETAFGEGDTYVVQRGAAGSVGRVDVAPATLDQLSHPFHVPFTSCRVQLHRLLRTGPRRTKVRVKSAATHEVRTGAHVAERSLPSSAFKIFCRWWWTCVCLQVFSRSHL